MPVLPLLLEFEVPPLELSDESDVEFDSLSWLEVDDVPPDCLLTVPELGLLVEDELLEELSTVPDDGLLPEPEVLLELLPDFVLPLELEPPELVLVLELPELFLLLELPELVLLPELLEPDLLPELLLFAAYDSTGAKFSENANNKSVVMNTRNFFDLFFMILLPSYTHFNEYIPNLIYFFRCK